MTKVQKIYRLLRRQGICRDDARYASPRLLAHYKDLMRIPEKNA
jgi:hypothetical protein